MKPGFRAYRMDELVEQRTERIEVPAESSLERYISLEHMDPESVSIRRWTTTDEAESSKFHGHRGDIVLGRRNSQGLLPFSRRTARLDQDYVCSAHAIVMKPKTNSGVDPDFLTYFMVSQRFWASMEKIGAGSISRHIYWRDLHSQTFDLPSLDEQLRVVDVMRLVDRAVQAAENLFTPTREHLMALSRSLWERTNDRVSILDVAVVRDRERRPVSGVEREYRKGQVPYYGATGQVGTIDTPLFDEDLLLVGEDGVDFSDAFRASYRISGPSWVNNHAHVLSSKHVEDAAGELDLLHLSLMGYQFGSVITGSTRSKLTLGELRKVSVPVIADAARGTAISEYRALMKIINSDVVDTVRAMRTSLLQELIG